MGNITLEHLEKVISGLDQEQLDKVLDYVNSLKGHDLMNERAKASEEAIDYGQISTLSQFNQDFKSWKSKRKSIK